MSDERVPAGQLRIAFVLPTLGSGGAERVTINLAQCLAAAGHTVAIVTLASARGRDAYPVPAEIERLDLGGAACDADGRASSGLAANVARVRALRSTLQRFGADVAVGMMTTCSVLVGIATVGTGIRAIGSERTHSPALPLSSTWEIARRYGYGLLDAMVVLTRETAEWTRTHTRARDIAVIPNQLIWPIPGTPSGALPDPAPSPGRSMLLAMGRLERQKGFDLLIDAFARIGRERPDWDLVIVGEGPLRSELEGRLDTLGLRGRVTLPGRSSDPARWYERADAFVMSSRFEGFPNALVEAMASGLACVSFECPTGPSDLIAHDESGLLVRPLDVDALADAMRTLTGDEALRRRLGSAARAVRERLAPANVMPHWIRLLSGGSAYDSRRATILEGRP